MANTRHAMSHAHAMHAMGPRVGRPKARAVIAASCHSLSRTLTVMAISSAFPMNAVALAMNSLGVVRMHLCLARPVSLADELAQV